MRTPAAVLAIVVLASCSSGGRSAVSGPGTPGPTSAPVATTAASTDATTPTSTAASTTTVPGVVAVLADDASGLAAQLVAAERTIRDPAAPLDAVAAEGRVQQLAYRRLGQRSDWVGVVAGAVPADLRDVFAANMTATTARQRAAAAAAAAGTTTPNPTPSPPLTLPAWHIRAPRPAAELLGYYKEAEAATGVPWQYLAAVNLVETRMGRIVGVSSAGAEGPMQFLPTTWARCCQGDVWNDHDAIVGAATYLAHSGAPGDMTAAILGYNPNQVYLEMVTSYANAMAADERAYYGYHAWQVFYGTAAGDVRLPEGYAADTPIDAAAYLTAHPEDRA